MSHTNRQLDMEDPLSPQPDPMPTPTLHCPSPNLHAMPRSHLRTADKQRADYDRLQGNWHTADGQLVDRGQPERQAAEQASPSGWGMHAAGPSAGGFKLARTPVGKTAGCVCPCLDTSFFAAASTGDLPVMEHLLCRNVCGNACPSPPTSHPAVQVLLCICTKF